MKLKVTLRGEPPEIREYELALTEPPSPFAWAYELGDTWVMLRCADGRRVVLSAEDVSELEIAE